MGNTVTSYSDDNQTREALAQAGSKRTLHEIYGLFYGSLAAPDPADAEEHVPVIFDDEAAALAASAEDVENVRRNLLSLWNFIQRWKPEEDPFYFPEQEYPANFQGLQQHLTDDLGLMQYFIAGLNLGGTETEDFSKDAIDALHELTDATTRLQKNIEVCAALDPLAADDDPEATAAMLDEIEDILADGIARVTIGLKHAKRSAQ
jgi:hypothetical protein